MTHEEALQYLEELVTEHNKALPEDIEKVDWGKTKTNILVTGGTDIAGLAEFSYEDFEEAGLPRALAKKAAKKFRQENEEEKAATTPTLPQTIVVKTGKPDDMPLRELLTAVSDGEKSVDYVTALRRYVDNRHVFVRVEGQEKIDVNATLEVIDHTGSDNNGPEFWGEQPTETLDEVLERRAYANPLTGVKLAKGDPWEKVSEERRVLAAYGRIAGKLNGNVDEYTLTDELQAKKLGGRWTRIEAAFKRDEKAHDPKVDQARAAIYYRKGHSTSSHYVHERPFSVGEPKQW